MDDGQNPAPLLACSRPLSQRSDLSHRSTAMYLDIRPLLFKPSTAALMVCINLLVLSALQSAICALVVIIQWMAAQPDDQQRAWRPAAIWSCASHQFLDALTTNMLGPVSLHGQILRCHTSDTPSTSLLTILC